VSKFLGRVWGYKNQKVDNWFKTELKRRLTAMGFDVYGIHPKSQGGRYFRATIHEWHPLWKFICEITPELDEEDKIKGQYNDGHKIVGEKHRAIVRELERYLLNPEEPRYRTVISQCTIYPEYETEPSILYSLSIRSIFGINDPMRVKHNTIVEFYKFAKNNRGFIIY
jgi:hypothetical protein